MRHPPYRTLAEMPLLEPVPPKEHFLRRLGLLLFLLAGPATYFGAAVLAGAMHLSGACVLMWVYGIPAYLVAAMYVSESKVTGDWSRRRLARAIAWSPVFVAGLLATLAWRGLSWVFRWVRDGDDE